MTVRDELQAQALFQQRYGTSPSPTARQIEQRVIGGDWGANGYTTVDQADELARRLALRPDHLLLDVGTGRGWPGLYLAARTGCRLVGADLPLDGLRAAMVQAGHQRLQPPVAMVAASAANLPFRRHTFDAIVHTDVLC